jgi:hypothetical protein
VQGDKNMSRKSSKPNADYFEKLKDPRWQKKRLEILERDGWRCKECAEDTKTLHVHHLLYQKGMEPWEIPNGFLVTLCEDCHNNATQPCPIQQGYKSCEECPDFSGNVPDSESRCDGPGSVTEGIALLLDALWKKGFDLETDLYALASAVNESEMPDGFPIECKLLMRKWIPPSKRKEGKKLEEADKPKE